MHRCFILLLVTGGILSALLLPSNGFKRLPEAKSQASHFQKNSSERIRLEQAGLDYERWLNEDVGYIITQEERGTFAYLTTDQERNQFIEGFWQRRNPNPDSVMNEFQDEHYRRIAYANEHFGTSVPGWKTDRGHVYILYGHPDEIEAHPRGRAPSAPGEGDEGGYPFESWRYRYLESMGTNVLLEFADQDGSGSYRVSLEPPQRRLLFQNGDVASDNQNLPAGARRTPESRAIEFLTVPTHSPAQVKFKDLNEIVSARIVRHQVQFALRTDCLRATSFTDLVPITLEIPIQQVRQQDLRDKQSVRLRVFLRVSTPLGGTAATVEDTVFQDLARSPVVASPNSVVHFERTVPLRPGSYQIAAVVEDSATGEISTVRAGLQAPQLFTEGLAASSLVLGEPTELPPAFNPRLKGFHFASHGILPRASGEFARSAQLGVYLQLYNLKVDDNTHRSDISIIYRMTRDGHLVLEEAEAPDLPGPSSEQLTILRQFSLASHPPGHYRIEVLVTDGVARRRISRTADFTIIQDTQTP